MKRHIAVAALIICSTIASAQSFTGTVHYVKAGGATEPLPFSQIYYIEKEKVLEADAEGRFSLWIGDTATFVATYVGYTRDTVVVAPGITSADFFITGENDLAESVVTGRQSAGGISKLKSVRTEVITSAGLCKMACCALAESFENSASVSVGYSDAVTGARQIKLLGLSGTYTQMLDENRPVMRGLAAPFGLSYVPGQWLESIQIAKGPSSVINGLEAITGQINMEHRKPTDETPLFVQVYGSSDAMYEANVASAVQMGPKWSVVNMAHVSGTASAMDHNGDTFRDEPEDLQLNFASRWLYYSPNGVQVRFGGSFLYDDRLGGQMGCTKDYTGNLAEGVWGSSIKNKGIDGYVKVGVPLNAENTANIAVVADFNHHEFDSFFGTRTFNGIQNSAFLNLIYQQEFGEMHRLEAGLTGQWDGLEQTLRQPFSLDLYADEDLGRKEGSVSAFGEYTLTLEDKFTFVGGVNLEYNSLHGWLFAPRANLKYSFSDDIVVRLLGGRGYRSANLVTDNLGILSTGSTLLLQTEGLNLLEDAWTFGGNITFYLPFGYNPDNTYLSFDYFRNNFNEQVIVDQEERDGFITFYNLGNGRSYTNTWQADFSVEAFERFNIVATFRYTDAKVTLKGQGLVERPMTSRYKGVLNLQYATAMNKWIFDFTAQVNGPMRLYRPAALAWEMLESPVYPMLYAQVTRKFRGIDVYIGGENLTNYRQKEAIVSASDPFSQDFNASCIWGPLMGIKVYAGLRYTLWKQ